MGRDQLGIVLVQAQQVPPDGGIEFLRIDVVGDRRFTGASARTLGSFVVALESVSGAAVLTCWTGAVAGSWTGPGGPSASAIAAAGAASLTSGTAVVAGRPACGPAAVSPGSFGSPTVVAPTVRGIATVGAPTVTATRATVSVGGAASLSAAGAAAVLAAPGEAIIAAGT
ncbi:hypothetical protein GCM10027289_28950 [Tsukamurella serpentis]